MPIHNQPHVHPNLMPQYPGQGNGADAASPALKLTAPEPSADTALDKSPRKSGDQRHGQKLQNEFRNDQASTGNIPKDRLPPILGNLRGVDFRNAALVSKGFRAVARNLTKTIRVKSAAELEQALKIYPNVEHIDARDLEDDDLAALQNCTRLQTLTLDCWLMTGAGLSNLPNPLALRELNLKRCSNFDQSSVAQLTRFTELEQLTLKNSPNEHLTKASVQIIGQFKKLQSLTLHKFDDLTDADLAHLDGLIDLRKLDLTFCEKINGSGLEHLHRLKQLATLNLACTEFNDAAIKHLPLFQALTALDIEHCPVTGSGFKGVKNLPGLQSLSMKACKQLCDEGLAQICKMASLERLTIDATACTNRALVKLGKLAQLRYLDIWNNHQPDTGDLMAHLGHLSQLRTLSMNDWPQLGTGNGDLQHIEHLKKLESIKLINMRKIRDTDLQVLKQLPALQTIYLKFCPLISGTELGSRATLKFIDLIYCDISDQGLANIGYCKSLQGLSITYAQTVTDKGLAHLMYLQKLKDLYIADCPKLTTKLVSEFEEMNIPDMTLRIESASNRN